MNDIQTPRFIVKELDFVGDSLLVLRGDTKQLSFDELKGVYDRLLRVFQRREILFLPTDAALQVMSAEELISVRDHLNDLIDTLRYDKLMQF